MINILTETSQRNTRFWVLGLTLLSQSGTAAVSKDQGSVGIVGVDNALTIDSQKKSKEESYYPHPVAILGTALIMHLSLLENDIN